MTQIFYSYITKENHKFLMSEIMPTFSDDFQDKILKYRRWEDAQLSMLGRVLIKEGFRKLNKDFKEKKLKYTEYGKPYLEEELMNFNIAHSGEIVVCALSETHKIGIDIEVIKDIEIEGFKFQMTDLEWGQIVSSNNIIPSFYDYWTKKEAVLKAHGMGLSIPLNSFEIINNQTKISEESFFLKKIELDNKYKCHLASENKICTTILSPVQMFYPYQDISSL